MPNLAAPEPPKLHITEDDAREDNSVTLSWDLVNNASEYYLTIEGEGLQWRLTIPGPPCKIHELQPGKFLESATVYQFKLSYKLGSTISDESVEMKTATRPLAPPAVSVFDDVLAPFPLIHWNLDTYPNLPLMSIYLGTFDVTSSAMLKLTKLGAINGTTIEEEFFSSGSDRQYALATNIPEPLLTSGLNWSRWGNKITVNKCTFASLKYPGLNAKARTAYSLIKKLNLLR